ncbi:hypothetical protein DL95DRAFT_472198 [Leptodontidium sp. 2 PMI_412]|nr:hypothetical protein DL95DRAFT_472198 [Leptodontidium sp. 2 PMI_412]
MKQCSRRQRSRPRGLRTSFSSGGLWHPSTLGGVLGSISFWWYQLRSHQIWEAFYDPSGLGRIKFGIHQLWELLASVLGSVHFRPPIDDWVCTSPILEETPSNSQCSEHESVAMKQSQAHVEDSRLEAERRRTFRGSARISLDALHFRQHKHRDLDKKHVEYLKGCFRKDQCRRLETVDLYTSGIDEDLKTCLNEQHSNKDRPTDGEAYSKIRYYRFQRDTKAELRWKACLRGCRLTDLKGLLSDEKFTAGFDALVDIPGVWDGMRLTTLEKMMAMGCRDECLSYLRRVKEVFTGLVGKDVLGRIDTATVKALERRAPVFSHRERDMTWEKLKMMDGLVPTLFTFFRDIQYLKLCIDCLKSLVIVPKRETICGTLARSYSDTNEREGYVRIQITGHTFLDRAGTPADSTGLGIRQLVALAMRHYPAMPADTVKEDPVQTAPTNADPAVLRSLADLAYDNPKSVP